MPQSERPEETASKLPTDIKPQDMQSREDRALFRRPDVRQETVLPAHERPAELTLQKPAAPTALPEQPRQIFETPPAEQIKVRLIENLETQKMEFRMQLQPQELGKIDVRMVMESGKLAVYIAAASTKAADALQRQSEGLAAALRMANIQVETVQIVQQPESKENHTGGAFNMLNSQTGNEQQQAEHSGAENPAGETQTEENQPQGPERLLDAAV